MASSQVLVSEASPQIIPPMMQNNKKGRKERLNSMNEESKLNISISPVESDLEKEDR